MYTRAEEATHVHRLPGYRLEGGVVKIQACVPQSDALPGQLAAFKKVWGGAMRVLHQRGLSKLTRGISIVFTERRGFYARFWKGNILCVNLRDLLAQGPKAQGTLLHELGHRVWFHIARQRTRARWAADHHARMKVDKHGSSFVSSYAHNNVLEDHAEAFRARMERTISGEALKRYEAFGPVTRTIQNRIGKAHG